MNKIQKYSNLPHNNPVNKDLCGTNRDGWFT